MLNTSYVELDDPEQADEQEVKGDEEAERPPHVWDALLLRSFVRLHPDRDGYGVDGVDPPAGETRIHAAAPTFHLWPRLLDR